MWTAYKNYWKNYFNFTGRTTRSGYWWVVLMNVIISVALMVGFVAAVMAAIVGLGDKIDTNASSSEFFHQLLAAGGIGIILLFFVLGIWVVLNIIPNIAITVRRIRDTGLSGWTYLISLLGGIMLNVSSERSDLWWMQLLGGLIALAFFIIYLMPSDQFAKKG